MTLAALDHFTKTPKRLQSSSKDIVLRTSSTGRLSNIDFHSTLHISRLPWHFSAPWERPVYSHRMLPIIRMAFGSNTLVQLTFGSDRNPIPKKLLKSVTSISTLIVLSASHHKVGKDCIYIKARGHTGILLQCQTISWSYRQEPSCPTNNG
jgi:hypothetical protein